VIKKHGNRCWVVVYAGSDGPSPSRLDRCRRTCAPPACSCPHLPEGSAILAGREHPGGSRNNTGGLNDGGWAAGGHRGQPLSQPQPPQLLWTA
jgi:hypothetical protein